MKNALHAIAGVFGFLCVLTFIIATVASALVGTPETIALVKSSIFKGMFVLVFALLAAGGTGASLLGKRTGALATAEQKRGPIGFMTSLFVLTPISYFLSSWAAEGGVDSMFYGLQAVELLGQLLVFVMVGLNIRDGLMLRGRIGGAAAITSTVSERDGGPLVVTQLPVLNNFDGKALAPKSVTALCRCGQSKNKPYCDGTHSSVAFDSTPSDDESKNEILVYEGSEVTIHYNRLLCSHAAECGTREKAAFDSSRKPWIIPDNASKEGLLEVVKACPSGALRYSLPGEAPQHSLVALNGITVEKDGPYRVTGLPFADARQAKGASPDKYVLCRCGASKNKPYCDGSHVDIGWRAS